MSSYTSSLGLELITPGSQAGLWGNTTNNTFTLIDQAVTGVTPISFASASGSTYTLTDYNGAADEARSAVLNITGTAIGANTVVIPNKQKTYLVRNNTGQDVTFQTAVPTATYTVGAGYSILIFCDGNNNVFTGIASPSVGTLSVSGGGTGTTTFLTGGFIKSAGGTSALTASQYVALGSEVSGTLPVGSGGTGVTSITANNLVVGAGTSAFTSIAPGTAGQVLTSNGTVWYAATPASGVTSVSASLPLSSSGGTTPTISLTGQVGVANGGTGVSTFAAGFVKSPGLASNLTTVTSIDLSTSDVSGTLTVGRGGTGAASLTNNAVVIGKGSSPVDFVSPGASGTVLTSNGSIWTAASLPSFVTAVSAGTGITVTGTTNPTITNAGVTSLTAGTGVTITGGSTGALTISASGTSGVASVGANAPLSITGTAANPVVNFPSFLSVVYGGTGATSFTSGALIKGAGTGALSPASAADIVAAIGTAAVTNATNASTAAACSGNAATVTNGVYTTGTQTIGGSKTFSSNVTLSNGATSQAYNFAATVSIYYGLNNVVISNNGQDFVHYSNGDFLIPGSNATKATGTTWINPSDQRLKSNVQDFTLGLSAALQIQPKSWVFNGKGGTTKGTKGVGVIADEIQNVLPETVTTYKAKLNPTDAEDTDIKQFDANDITWVLVNAVKELKAELDAAKARIAELESK